MGRARPARRGGPPADHRGGGRGGRACARDAAPVVTRGAGTGLSGGANAVDGCVVLSTERMREIVEINPAERLAVVQPGVVNDDLRAAVAEQGLWYPPDPASAPWSTIGGNVATNAGGLCCVKYGVTRDYVLALEVVTAAGEVVRVGRRTAKGVAGYDLVGLLVGSEGTLGVITEVTVRLPPAADHRAAHRRRVLRHARRGRRRGLAGHRARAATRGVRADRPGLPARGQRLEARRAAGGLGRPAAGPDRPARAGRRGRGGGDPRRVRRGRRPRGDGLHRSRRGRGPVRRPAARLPGPGAARRGHAHRGRLPSARQARRDAGARRGDLDAGTTR